MTEAALVGPTAPHLTDMAFARRITIDPLAAPDSDEGQGLRETFAQGDKLMDLTLILIVTVGSIFAALLLVAVPRIRESIEANKSKHLTDGIPDATTNPIEWQDDAEGQPSAQPQVMQPQIVTPGTPARGQATLAVLLGIVVALAGLGMAMFLFLAGN